MESGPVKVMHWAWGNGSERFAGEYFYFSLWTDVDSSAAHYQEALERDDQWRLLLRATQNDGMKDLQMLVMDRSILSTKRQAGRSAWLSVCTAMPTEQVFMNDLMGENADAR